ncbi:unnamed protein product, partial [Discosporangium mesarthrocarpum]
QVKLWNVETKECAMAFKGHTAEVTDVQFSPDGYMLASSGSDGQVKLWDLRTGKAMHNFQACSGPVQTVRFNPQEFLLAVATSERTVKLYDIEFMELFCSTSPDSSPTRALAFEPEGQKVYCVSTSGLRRWSWDNSCATTRLERYGDIGWGSGCPGAVIRGSGALHLNSEGRQLVLAACTGKLVSIWAVDDDDGSEEGEDYQGEEKQQQQWQQQQQQLGGLSLSEAMVE